MPPIIKMGKKSQGMCLESHYSREEGLSSAICIEIVSNSRWVMDFGKANGFQGTTVSSPSQCSKLRTMDDTAATFQYLPVVYLTHHLTSCEIRFVFWLLRASGRVEPYTR